MHKLSKAISARDVLATMGLGLLSGGLAMLSIPLALIVSGALLFAVAVIPLLIPPGRGE